MRVFKTKLIRLQLTEKELAALTADFISYKRDGILPDILDVMLHTTARTPGRWLNQSAWRIFTWRQQRSLSHRSCGNSTGRMTKRIWSIVRAHLMNRRGC